MGSGYVYRGKSMPQLRGKYVFTDILNGRLFYADFNDMLAARVQLVAHACLPKTPRQVKYRCAWMPLASADPTCIITPKAPWAIRPASSPW